ncbi:MAG TPA: SDR family NAD(P)-dependent oxidoreductase [Bacteroidota bacterium]|jgi:NADP-dependent 3-hydroxy acid dehydrogenase YdfG
MNSVKGKIVCITGASSGIGAACADEFAKNGASLLLLARRQERIAATAKSLAEKYKVHTLALTLDVQKQPEVERLFTSIPAEWKKIDILVNNAGLSRGLDKLHEAKIDDWEEMIDTNIKGLLYVTRAVLPSMVERNEGHVIHIGSIAGRQTYPGGNVYCATKHAVLGLTHGMKMDLLGTNVRVSSVDPGLVETEFSSVRYRGNEELAAKAYANTTVLQPADIAEIVLFCATRPPHVNILETVVLATNQASASMVHRTAPA